MELEKIKKRRVRSRPQTKAAKAARWAERYWRAAALRVERFEERRKAAKDPRVSQEPE